MPPDLAQLTYDALTGRVVFGRGVSAALLAQEVERLGCERVLVVAAGPERDLARRLVAPLRDRVAATFEEVRPHASGPQRALPAGCRATAQSSRTRARCRVLRVV